MVTAVIIAVTVVGLPHTLGVVAGELVGRAVAVAGVARLALVTAVGAVVIVVTLPCLKAGRYARVLVAMPPFIVIYKGAVNIVSLRLQISSR